MRIILVFIAALLAQACGRQNAKYDKRYIDVDSLISAQIELLRTKPIVIQKEAIMKESKSGGQVKADSAALARELDIFRQIDFMNKPLFRDQYQISIQPDPRSNLTMRVYEAKVAAPVKYLKIYFFEQPSRLRKIESYFEEENSLYFTSRKYTLDFNEENSKSILVKSSMTGVQKMILSDSVSFSVTSTYQVH